MTSFIHTVGFCGIDASVSPLLLSLMSSRYPFIEWGVLFREDKEGEPRYAEMGWVEGELRDAWERSNGAMKLAGHLCGGRVDEVLGGDSRFVNHLCNLGFGRIQINPTKVNGVNTENLREKVPNVLKIMANFPAIDFIIQKSDETQPLWQGILDETGGKPPANMSMLQDESKGTGKLITEYSPIPSNYNVGFAGGLGPETVSEVVKSIMKLEASSGGRRVWIDMESRLRSERNNEDVFCIEKCAKVISNLCAIEGSGFKL